MPFINLKEIPDFLSTQELDSTILENVKIFEKNIRGIEKFKNAKIQYNTEKLGNHANPFNLAKVSIEEDVIDKKTGIINKAEIVDYYVKKKLTTEYGNYILSKLINGSNITIYPSNNNFKEELYFSRDAIFGDTEKNNVHKRPGHTERIEIKDLTNLDNDEAKKNLKELKTRGVDLIHSLRSLVESWVYMIEDITISNVIFISKKDPEIRKILPFDYNWFYTHWILNPDKFNLETMKVERKPLFSYFIGNNFNSKNHKVKNLQGRDSLNHILTVPVAKFIAEELTEEKKYIILQALAKVVSELEGKIEKIKNLFKNDPIINQFKVNNITLADRQYERLASVYIDFLTNDDISNLKKIDFEFLKDTMIGNITHFQTEIDRETQAYNKRHKNERQILPYIFYTIQTEKIELKLYHNGKIRIHENGKETVFTTEKINDALLYLKNFLSDDQTKELNNKIQKVQENTNKPLQDNNFPQAPSNPLVVPKEILQEFSRFSLNTINEKNASLFVEDNMGRKY